MEPNFARLAVGRPRWCRSVDRQLTDSSLLQNTLLEEEPNWTRLDVGRLKWPFRLTVGWPTIDRLCTTAQFKSEFQFCLLPSFFPFHFLSFLVKSLYIPWASMLSKGHFHSLIHSTISPFINTSPFHKTIPITTRHIHSIQNRISEVKRESSQKFHEGNERSNHA